MRARHSFLHRLQLIIISVRRTDLRGKRIRALVCTLSRNIFYSWTFLRIYRLAAVVFPLTTAVLWYNAHRKARSYVKAVKAVSTEAYGEKPRTIGSIHQYHSV